MAVPYAVVPPGSLANARAAASLSPSTSTMSSEGAPRAKEIVSAAMTARVAATLPPARSAREQVREQRAARDHDQQHDHQQHPEGPLHPARRREPRRVLAGVWGLWVRLVALDGGSLRLRLRLHRSDLDWRLVGLRRRRRA